MKCPNCGNESADGAKFCKFCGTKLVTPEAGQTPPEVVQTPPVMRQAPPAEPQNRPAGSAADRFAGMKETGAAKFAEAKVAGAAGFAKAKEAGAAKFTEIKDGGAAAAIDNVKKSNKMPIIIAAVVVVALIAIGAFVIPGLNKTTIDLQDFVRVYANGYDGYGYLNLDRDYDAFMQQLYLAAESTEPIYMFENSIGYPEADKYEDLSNGDKITITWKMPEGLGKACKAKFKNETFTFKVSDLQKVEKVDIFKDCEFQVDGNAPHGYAYIDSQYDIDFNLDKSSDLSNGDKVTVTISVWDGEDVQEYLARNYGVTAESLSKEYEVSGLPTYVTQISQISDSFMNELDRKVRNTLTNYVNTNWAKESKLGNVDLLGCYFFEDDYEGGTLYLVYKVHYDNTKTGVSDDYYFYGKFYDPLIASDGSGTVTDGYDDYVYTSLDNYMTYTFSDGYYVYGYGSLDDLYKDIQDDNGYRPATDSTVQ